MHTALDAVVEIFTWVGFIGAVAFGFVALALWAFDGTWLPVEAIVDHEDDGTWVRWFDGDGEANNARADHHTAAQLAGRDRADVWYRHGWRGRMRLTRRAPLLRAMTGLAVGLFALGVVSMIGSWVVLFLPR